MKASFNELLNRLQDYEYEHPGQSASNMDSIAPEMIDNVDQNINYWLAQIGHILTNNYFLKHVEINELLNLPYKSRRVERAMKKFKSEYLTLEEISEALTDGKNWN